MKIDPQRNDPWPVRLVGSSTAFGLVCIMFVLMSWRLLTADERMKVYFNMVKEQVNETLERENIRADRDRKIQDERLRETVKTLMERHQIEQERTRAEIRALAKLLEERKQ
jgi:hypothetical protein